MAIRGVNENHGGAMSCFVDSNLYSRCVVGSSARSVAAAAHAWNQSSIQIRSIAVATVLQMRGMRGGGHTAFFEAGCQPAPLRYSGRGSRRRRRGSGGGGGGDGGG
jgi:hypothetical protein